MSMRVTRTGSPSAIRNVTHTSLVVRRTAVSTTTSM